MVILCDDNETNDNAPTLESYDYSERIDELSDLMIRVTALAQGSMKMLKVTNALYEWHVSRNHFPDTRGQQCYGGRITLIAAPPLVPYETPVASPTVKGHHKSFNWNAYARMRERTWEMRYCIWDLYLNPNTCHDWNVACFILLVSREYSTATLNSKSCTSLDSNKTIQPEPTRTQVQVESQPEPVCVAGPEARPCSYQDFLDALFVFETRFTALYEQCRLEHKMTEEMYEWHLGQNHFTEKCHVILSKL